MINIYTIGFTKKSAESFFNSISENKINLVIDVRLNNNSQLAGFSKYPDVVYFLKKCCNCDYVSDKQFAPKDTTLLAYRKNEIDWDEYVVQFYGTMKERDINQYILDKYSDVVKSKTICLLCSEEDYAFCHRTLVAKIFQSIFQNVNLIHLK